MIKDYKFLFLKLIYIGLLGVSNSGCMPDTNYQSYVDQKQKGEQAFYEDVSLCRNYASLHARKSEGSQGSGERFIQEQKLFSLCMERKQWIPKS